MGATSITRTYNARLTNLLDKIRPVLQNQITTANPFYFKYKKSGNWKTVSELGDRYRVPLMYEFAPVGTFGANGVGQVDVTPTDGMTPAFFEWSRLASSITIGDFERAQNKGAAIDLLKSKTEQAMLGLEDRFGRWLLQGQGAIDGTTISTARTDPTNGSTFILPIPAMIYALPTDSFSVGEINQSTNTWWANQYVAGASTSTFAGILKDLDHLINLCTKGAGPGPDLFVADLMGYEVICAALRSAVRYVDYEDINFPFKSVRINGNPLTFDQFVPDALATATTTVASGAHSTVYAVNTKFAGIAVYSGADFTAGDFVRTPNGAGETALVQWYGTHWCSRRDKQGVLTGLNNSVVA
jgi:hypothetical protein